MKTNNYDANSIINYHKISFEWKKTEAETKTIAAKSYLKPRFKLTNDVKMNFNKTTTKTHEATNINT